MKKTKAKAKKTSKVKAKKKLSKPASKSKAKNSKKASSTKKKLAKSSKKKASPSKTLSFRPKAKGKVKPAKVKSFKAPVVAAGPKKKSTRIGIFGGTFNPFHNGHLNSLRTVAAKMNLKNIFVVPSFQTPGKPFVASPTPEQRLELTQLGISDDQELLKIDEQELNRRGLSYTVDTLEQYAKSYNSKNLFLIVGADLFSGFHKWKEFDRVLGLANLVVTTRPGFILPFQLEDIQPELREFVADINREKVTLTTGRTIHFLQLEDQTVSGTEIRKCVRSGLQIDKYVSIPVEKYIKEQNLYAASPNNTLDFKEITKFAAEVLFDKKGFHVKAFDLSQINAPSEYAVIASGTSTRHTVSLGEHVQSEIKRRFGLNPVSLEGLQEGRWVLVDFGGLIVHVFYDFVRQEYLLEQLWKGSRDLHVKDPAVGLSLNQ